MIMIVCMRYEVGMNKSVIFLQSLFLVCFDLVTRQTSKLIATPGLSQVRILVVSKKQTVEV